MKSPTDRSDRAARERDAARGTIDSIMEAIKGDRFSDGLQTAEDYVRHVLGTAGHLYHVEGYMDIIRERDEALTALREAEAVLRRAQTYIGLLRQHDPEVPALVAKAREQANVVLQNYSPAPADEAQS